MNVEAYDEKIRIWKCGACDSWSYDQNVAEECCSSESFEANFNPNQPRNSAGRWVEQVEVSEMIESEPAMDFDMDELMALADAIRLQDATFPDVDMLLETNWWTLQRTDKIIFDEMMVVMSNLVNQVVAPQEESPAEYYKYIFRRGQQILKQNVFTGRQTIMLSLNLI